MSTEKIAALLSSISLVVACTPQAPIPPSAIFAEPMSVFFDSESVSLNREAQAVIRLAIGRARKFDCGKLLVTGYTDDSKYERGGVELSFQRANVVREELLRDGYRGAITAEGRGSSDPFKPNAPGQPEPLNHRAVIGFGCRID